MDLALPELKKEREQKVVPRIGMKSENEDEDDVRNV